MSITCVADPVFTILQDIDSRPGPSSRASGSSSRAKASSSKDVSPDRVSAVVGSSAGIV